MKRISRSKRTIHSALHTKSTRNSNPSCVSYLLNENNVNNSSYYGLNHERSYSSSSRDPSRSPDNIDARDQAIFPHKRFIKKDSKQISTASNLFASSTKQVKLPSAARPSKPYVRPPFPYQNFDTTVVEPSSEKDDFADDIIGRHNTWQEHDMLSTDRHIHTIDDTEEYEPERVPTRYEKQKAEEERAVMEGRRQKERDPLSDLIGPDGATLTDIRFNRMTKENLGHSLVGKLAQVGQNQYQGDNYTDFETMPDKEFTSVTGLQWDPATAETWQPAEDFPIDLPFDEMHHRGPNMWYVRRYSIQRKKGRVESFAATLLNGDGKGSAGWGRGKGNDVSEALRNAKIEMKKRTIHLWRYEDRTLGEGAKIQFRRTRCLLRVMGRGIGNMGGGWQWRMIFRCFGVTEVTGRWFGSQRRHVPRLKVAFLAIRQTKHPVQIADSLGMRLFHPRGIHRKGKAANWKWGLN